MAPTLIFVRHKVSLKFLNQAGRWVLSFSKARFFPSTLEALEACLKQRIHQAEIVMRFGVPKYDVVLDIR